MLDVQPARRRLSSRGRFGLALAGGGPLGAFYEVGTLHAIGESFDGIDLTNLDMYVGVSSGAMIAAGLVNGYDTADMGLVFIHNASQEHPVRPGLFLRPAFREYLRRVNAIPGLAADILMQYLRDPGKDWAEAIDPLGGCCRPACATTGRSSASWRRCSPGPAAPTTSASCAAACTSSPPS
jgi:hypothetical protein